MSEKVEHVARAMWDHDRYLSGRAAWDSISIEYREAGLHIARLAIEAMREPTETMLEAGGVNAHPLDRQDANEVWRDMIDEALK